MDERLPSRGSSERGLRWKLRCRVERWLEKKGHLSPYRRLIVVCGMARTGTSALAAYLASHPDLRLVVGGPLWHRLESDYVRSTPNWEFIDGVLDEFFPCKIVIKQPWLEKNYAFFERAKAAKVIVCLREMETLFSSWSTSPYVGIDCKERPLAVNLRFLMDFMMLKTEAGRKVMEVRKEGMSPDLARPLGEFIGVNPDGFDPKRITSKWTGVNDREWVESIAIWRDKR